ncbi:MAG TPA: (d)CMP kinase [Balneolales bacterium]|nr:(d)CMP kinase [Balneolales bacterium]
MMIVIDGPAGSGKSSTAKAIANRTDIQYIDSGALYRAVTLIFLEHSGDRVAFFDAFDKTEISFSYSDKLFRVFLDGHEVTREIRTQQVADNVSKVASDPEIRERVNTLMRKQVKRGNFIADGRDLSTVVFPDADLKFFMECDLDTRAKRRYEELTQDNHNVSFEEIRRNLSKRDHMDSSRKHAPLKKSPDAIVIDTSNLSFREQVDIILNYIYNKEKTSPGETSIIRGDGPDQNKPKS